MFTRIRNSAELTILISTRRLHLYNSKGIFQRINADRPNDLQISTKARTELELTFLVINEERTIRLTE